MEHQCKCGNKVCGERKALETAVDQYHKWGDVINGIGGIPPLVNVHMSAYTMDFFLRETGLLKLLFAPDPKKSVSTNTNMATVLYDEGRLMGIAIEYGNNDKAYVALEELDADTYRGISDWRNNPELHAAELRTRIRAYTGRDIGLIKCADLKGFFGSLDEVVYQRNTLEMLVAGVKFACNAVAQKSLSIQPEPKFFSYLRALNNVTDVLDAKDTAGFISEHLGGFSLGLVLQNRRGEVAAVGLGAGSGIAYFEDFGARTILLREVSLKSATETIKNAEKQTMAVGLSTNFLYNAMHAALTHSPYKLGKAVAKALWNEEIVVC